MITKLRRQHLRVDLRVNNNIYKLMTTFMSGFTSRQWRVDDNIYEWIYESTTITSRQRHLRVDLWVDNDIYELMMTFMSGFTSRQWHLRVDLRVDSDIYELMTTFMSGFTSRWWHLQVDLRVDERHLLVDHRTASDSSEPSLSSEYI